MNEKTAVITGAAQGIGKAIAIQLFNLKINSIVIDMDEEAGAELPEGIHFIKASVANDSELHMAIQKAKKITGRIDFLVNNAGIGITKPIAELSLSEWNTVLATNLTSVFLCTKYCENELKRNKGQIINIASTRAFMSEPDTEAYSASKGGIVALTHALAISLAPHVRVNCISPGWIEVCEHKKNSLKQTPVHTEADKMQHPVGRVGVPDDIANMVSYLLQQDNSFITGQNFIIDGGMTRKMIYV